MDRFAEKYADFSQYQYAANNLISNIDECKGRLQQYFN
ncbi:hypothetical protein [Pedobacter gandavensis]